MRIRVSSIRLLPRPIWLLAAAGVSSLRVQLQLLAMAHVTPGDGAAPPAELDHATKSSFDVFAETFSNWRTLASLGSEPILRIVSLGGVSSLLSCLAQPDCSHQMLIDAAATLALLSGVEIARQDILQLQGLQRLVDAVSSVTLPHVAITHAITAIINLTPCDGVISALSTMRIVPICLHAMLHAHPGIVAQSSFLLRLIADDSHNCYSVFLSGTQLLRAALSVLASSTDEESLCNSAFLASALYREIPLFVKTPSRGVYIDEQLVATYDDCVDIQRRIADACLLHVASSPCLPVVTLCMLALFEISKNYDSAIYMHSQGVVDNALRWSHMRMRELPEGMAEHCKSPDVNLSQQLQVCVLVASKLVASMSSVSNVILLEISSKEMAIVKARE